jgi:hypothetical protein
LPENSTLPVVVDYTKSGDALKNKILATITAPNTLVYFTDASTENALIVAIRTGLYHGSSKKVRWFHLDVERGTYKEL